MTAPDPGSWMGRTESCADNLDVGQAERVALSLGDAPPGAGDGLPLLYHWAFFVKPEPYADLADDGHAKLGGFLPATPDRRNRMWAGGRLTFLRPLSMGVAGERRSIVTAVAEKQGRTGRLLFVTVKHDYVQNGEVCIEEEQDIVYREPAPPVLAGTAPPATPEWSETIRPDPVMLFRYSAVTFNAHRIHYDDPYVRNVEGYPGLVVHGPLIATLMVRAFTHAHPDVVVRSLSYRGLRPLIAPKPFRVAGRRESANSAVLWAEQDGALAHRGSIRFEG